MAQWRQELIGENADLTDVTRAFAAPPIRVLEENGHFYLEADQFEELADQQAVRASAMELLNRINGAMRLGDRGFQNVTLGPLHELRPDGSRATSVFVQPATIRVRARVEPATIVGGGPTPLEPDPRSRLVEIASRDKDAHDSLDLWANEPHNWVNLYKVLEIVSSRGGLAVGAATDADISRFTHTANHEKAAGREARHPDSAPTHPRAP